MGKSLNKNHETMSEEQIRIKYGLFTGIIGIITNIFLLFVKVFIGLLSGSISILANAVDSLSDSISSVITIISFRLSGKEPDEEHPFGHERIEYIAGLILSFLILFIGMNLFWNSSTNIFNVKVLNIELVTIIVLVICILVKVGQSIFYIKIGKKINSIVVLAAGKDAFNDILTTTAVLFSTMIMWKFNIVSFNLDALMATFISIFILYSGIKIFKEASSPLIGTMPDKEIVDSLLDIVLKEKEILGYHDLVVHSYGPNKIYSSLHLEFDYRINILEIHEVIDALEKEVYEKLNIELVIHMDPVVTDDKETISLKEKVSSIVSIINKDISIHDFRLVKGKKISKVLFDCVVPNNMEISITDLKKEINKQVCFINPKYECQIVIDKNYICKRN